MSNGVTAGNFTTLTDLQSSRPREGTILSLTTGERYYVDIDNAGSGLLLANGLYANRMIDPDTEYLYQYGVAEWNSGQEYYDGSACIHNNKLWFLETGDNPSVNEEPGVSTQWKYTPLTDPIGGSTLFPGAVRISGNNVDGLQQLSEFGTYQNLAFIDSDGNAVFGPTDPRMFNLYSVPTNGKMHKYVEAHEFSDLSSLTAGEFHTLWAGKGVKETQVSTGGTLSDLAGFGRGMIEMSTGTTASDAGWLLDFTNYLVSTASFNMLELMYDIPAPFDLRLEFGLWDGTLDNAIWIERVDGVATTGALVAKCAKAGVASTVSLDVGDDALRHSIRINRVSPTSVEFYDSNSDVAAGQFQLVGSLSTNVPDGISLRPFIRFRGFGTPTVNKTMRWDKISLICNW